MASIKAVRSWNVIWDKLQSFLGFSGVDSPFASGPLVIDEPLTLYVETWGNDTNPGTQDKPFKTIQAALDWLKPYEISAAVTVQVGAGTFDGFVVRNIEFYTQQASQNSTSLTIQGVTTVTDSGSCTSSTSADGFLILTDPSKSWTVNQYKGSLVAFTTPSGITVRSFCFANTATTMTLLVGGGTPYVSYTVESIQTSIVPKPTDGISTCSFFYGPYVGQGSSNTVAIKRLRMQGNGPGAVMRGGARAAISECEFSGSGSLGCVLYGGNINVSHCLFNACSLYAAASNVVLGELTVGSVLFRNSTSSLGSFFNTGCTAKTTGALVFDNCTLGMYMGGTRLLYSATGAGCLIRFDNCATGMSLLRSSVTELQSGYLFRFSGSGNTTVFSVNKGSTLQIGSASTVTGTTELNVDGAASTIAAMRANSPKVFPLTPNPYGSYVYE